MNLDALSGHTAPSFDDPVGMLHACHRRIEKQLATLDRLQRHLPEHGCDADARSAARNILRYFDTAGMNHHADEEHSVFPRLVLAAGAEAKTLTIELERQHGVLAESWTHMRALLAGIAAGQRANLSPRDVLSFREAYARHIALEEQTLLPLAQSSLDADALRVIGEEMAARRNVDAPGERLA